MKKSTFSATEYLQQAPEPAAIMEKDGGRFLPILTVENDLDPLRWSTTNFKWEIFKDGYAKLQVAASLELILNYQDEDGNEVVRSFVGACNFPYPAAKDPIQDWLATAKSQCIKNAASDAGKKLGRGLNEEVVPRRGLESVDEVPKPKQKPDKMMRERIEKAIKEGDVGALSIWSNIYDFEIPENGNKII